MKKSVPFTGGEAFDRVFRALGDPHRMQIIALLREKELSAGEILDAVDVVQSTLSHHMKTLSDSGAVNAVRRGKWTYYSLNESKLAQAAAFLEEYSKGTRVRKAFDDSEGSQNQGETGAGDAGDSGIRIASRAMPQESAEEPLDASAAKKTSGSKPAASSAAGSASGTGQTKKSGKKKDKEKDKKTKKNKKSKK